MTLGPEYQLLRVAASLGAAQIPSFTGTHGNDADNRRGNPNQPDTWQQIVTERPLEQLGLWGDRWHPAYAFENRTQALAFRRVHVFHKGYAALQVRAELRVRPRF